jgi:hypothetical protein
MHIRCFATVQNFPESLGALRTSIHFVPEHPSADLGLPCVGDAKKQGDWDLLRFSWFLEGYFAIRNTNEPIG